MFKKISVLVDACATISFSRLYLATAELDPHLRRLLASSGSLFKGARFISFRNLFLLREDVSRLKIVAKAEVD